MITGIVAMTYDKIIAYDGKIPWYSRTDLKRFKKLTMDKACIVGGRMVGALPPLPGRTICSLSRTKYDLSKPEYQAKFLNWRHANPSGGHSSDPNEYLIEGMWCIGGGQIYDLYYPHMSRIHVSLFEFRESVYNSSFDMDKATTFSKFKWEDWRAEDMQQETDHLYLNLVRK